MGMWPAAHDARTLQQPMANVAPVPSDMKPVMAVPVMAVPVMVAPGQNCMNGIGANGMDHIALMHSLQVQEKANLLQEITAALGMEVEMANKYKVLDDRGNQVFYAVEQTGCCRRQLQNGCCHDCAPYDVHVFYTPPGQQHQNFITMTRPCQLTCCCFNRPTADVTDAHTQQKIGSFRDPCTCCLLKFQVRDAADNEVLLVDGGCVCCQPGMLCPLPCGPCSKVDFIVRDAAYGHQVAQVSKQVPSCLSWCFAPDVDNYQLQFEQVTNPQWKSILLAFTIFMDFRYFNVNRNEEEARAAAQNLS